MYPQPSKTILCTLGPASWHAQTIQRLTEVGVGLFRLNLSHTPVDRLEELIALIRNNSDVPICLDTQGAQIRTGNLAEGTATFKTDAKVKLVPAPHIGDSGNLSVYPGSILRQLLVGDLISVDFDTIPFQVIETGRETWARVLAGGTVGSNKAIAVDRIIKLPPMTEMDKEAIALGNKLGIDHVALSFANHHEEVELLRNLVGDQVTIIAKVESWRGLQDLDRILQSADAILIDRGDLAREVPIENLPFIQKDVIATANQAGVPVYVATNLLESMVVNPIPTRAEANDIINTLLDGADGLVLAAETAVGNYPVGCASMIRSFIDHYSKRGRGHPWEPSLNGSVGSRLTHPHGGKLVQQIISDPLPTDLESLTRLDVDEYVAMDARQIAIGTFSPLDGFMDQETLESVLQRNCLPDETAWPMPILLPLPQGSISDFPTDEPIGLTYQGIVFALLTSARQFTFDLNTLAKGWFGTENSDHPGVSRVYRNGDKFLSGKVSLLPNALQFRKPYDISPAQARQVFEHRHWQRVVGFHTRNVPHMAHEFLQFAAMEKAGCDGIFIHPVTGPKKVGDFSGDINLKTYELLIDKFYPSNKALLGGFLTYSRYAGPREAVFTALCRQNFGCSHFIVGRDHTGVGDYYRPDASQHLFSEIGNIEITPLFFNEIYYCQRCQTHVEQCDHGGRYSETISGTQVREMFSRGEVPPDWFMRNQVSQLILEELNGGGEVFAT